MDLTQALTTVARLRPAALAAGTAVERHLRALDLRAGLPVHGLAQAWYDAQPAIVAYRAAVQRAARLYEATEWRGRGREVVW